jgi:hypothetical protein
LIGSASLAPSGFDTIFGFIGVVFGSISTASLTIYKERVTSRREIEQRDRQYHRDQATVRDVYQRDGVLALQTAVTSLISAAYAEVGLVVCCGPRGRCRAAHGGDRPAHGRERRLDVGRAAGLRCAARCSAGFSALDCLGTRSTLTWLPGGSR